jgi:DNA repair protein RadC
MQAQKYLIKDWPKDERPREKLLTKGPRFLSNTELLALLLRHGNAKKSAIDLAREILQLGNNDLYELGRVTVSELMKIEGIGEAKAISIAAALELGRRRQAPLPDEKTIMRHSRDIAHYFQGLFRDLTYEVFAVVFLNRSNRINHYEIISEGGITGTVADPRIILKKAIMHDAVNIVLCHNHPSGSLSPSRADEELTLKIKEAAKYLDIKIMDHLIVSENGYFSFADEGIL